MCLPHMPVIGIRRYYGYKNVVVVLSVQRMFEACLGYVALVGEGKKGRREIREKENKNS